MGLNGILGRRPWEGPQRGQKFLVASSHLLSLNDIQHHSLAQTAFQHFTCPDLLNIRWDF